MTIAIVEFEGTNHDGIKVTVNPVGWQTFMMWLAVVAASGSVIKSEELPLK